MYYITEAQLKQILTGIKALPVKADDFDAADLWVGLYLTVQNVARQPIKDNDAAKNCDEQKEE